MPNRQRSGNEMKMLRQPMGAVSSTVRYILRAACNFFLAFGTLALGHTGFVFVDSHAYTGHDLILLSYFPIYYVGPAPKRLVVHALEVQDVLLPYDAVENEVQTSALYLRSPSRFKAGTSQ